MPNWPTMDEYQEQARQRAVGRLETKSPPEQMVYLNSMSLVRQGAVFSGISEWTPAHTTGALFTSSSLKASLKELHNARVINHQTMDALLHLVEMQEDIVIHLDTGS